MPTFQLLGEFQSSLVISNKIIDDNEYSFPAAEMQKRVEFSDQLRRRFRPRAASVDRYDVAKLTRKRAASRKLHRHEGVFLQCQQVETRHRRATDIRFFRNTVQPAG